MATTSNKDSNDINTGVTSADSGGDENNNPLVTIGLGESRAPTIETSETTRGDLNKAKASGVLTIDPVRLSSFPALF
jgi:hypothetical protein